MTKTLKLEQYVEWVDPLDQSSVPVIMRAKVSDIITFQRKREPRYTSDQQALDDFIAVNWATVVYVSSWED